MKQGWFTSFRTFAINVVNMRHVETNEQTYFLIPLPPMGPCFFAGIQGWCKIYTVETRGQIRTCLLGFLECVGISLLLRLESLVILINPQECVNELIRVSIGICTDLVYVLGLLLRSLLESSMHQLDSHRSRSLEVHLQWLKLSSLSARHGDTRAVCKMENVLVGVVRG